MNLHFEKGLTRSKAEEAYARRPITRRIRAGLRDTRVLLAEFRGILITFAAVMALLTLSFRAFWNGAGNTPQLTFSRSLYSMLGLMLFQPDLDFPRQWFLQAFFFVAPLVGVVFLGLGLTDFAVLLFNRRVRGKKWEEAVASTFANHTIICGLGNVGIRVVRQMIGLHEDVVAIELKEDNPHIMEARRYGIPVIIGDTRAYETLEKAGIREATAVIICTNDDLVNLQTASRIREVNHDARIVLRLFEEEFGRQFAAALNIDAVLSASALSAPAFAGAAIKTEILNTFTAAGKVLNLGRIDIQPGSRLDGCQIGQLEAALEISVVLQENAGRADTIPAGDLTLSVGDTLYVVAEMPALRELTHDWNRCDTCHDR